MSLNRSIINHVPTFILKKIDPQKLKKLYQQGHYAKLKIPSIKIKLPEIVSLVAPEYGGSSDDPIFIFKDKNNVNIIHATSNHKVYEFFTKNGGELPKGGRCEWCLQDYKDEGIPEPFALKEISYLVSTPDPEGKIIHKMHNKFVFWGEGQACSFECRYAKNLEQENYSCSKRSSSSLSSTRMLLLLHKLTYPNGSQLKPALHFRLLDKNHGVLSESDFRSNKTIWKRTPNVLLIPAKTLWLKMN